ncbi:MAG: DegT/DnrJ/EryC1/StrS family aminotransferase [Hahellaceae bacterium]|nr:DegT/DnrJ/EryC1/StrS family aminotransferase [Hahellaceae bacterium]MCP5211752.1 DegT/DnrJ/EryC1/StrS family aminotransferase [Hahellaceae bacterium]
MEFIDLKQQYQQLKAQIDRNIQTVLEHGKFIMGPEVAQVETALSEFCGARYCITTASGTDALLLALMSTGIKPGDEVITTPFSFFATAEVISLLGAIPVFVDVEPDTLNIDPQRIVPAITPKTKAIMPVSLYGQCADFSTINKIAEHYQLSVIEDGAQSFGATQHGKKSCNLSSIGCTSFFPSKPLGCYGDGGALFTNDERIAESVKSLRIHGQTTRYIHDAVGINGRMDTLQAAILLAKLTIFPEEVSARMEIGGRYTQLINSKRNTHEITPTCIKAENTSVFAQYTIQTEQRDTIKQKLESKGVPTAIHYPKPIHLQTPYLELKATCPEAEKAAERVISLPMHPYLTREQQEEIVDILFSP